MKHFDLATVDLAKKLFKIKDAKKSNQFVEEIKNRWIILKNKIEKMPKKEIESKTLNGTLGIINEIIDFNKENQNQLGKGLKILTPNQMLSRLPISLAQLIAGNNSEKLKNEIRQLVNSFYRSKKFTKQIYKSLIDII